MIRLSQIVRTISLRVWLLTVVALFFGACSNVANAQTVWGKAGTSTLMDASGFEVEYKWNKWMPVQGWIGLGHSDSFNIGGYLQTKTHGYDVGLGDRYLPFALSTDVFDQSRYFSARGAFVHKDYEKNNWTAFGGATSGEISYSFYRSFVTADPTAGFIYQHKLSDRITLQSFNFVQGKVTSLQSLKFAPKENLTLGVSAGIGNNEGEFSVAGDYAYRWMRLTGSYTASEDNFRRINGVSSLAPERTGLNVRALMQPWRRLQLTAGHENMISPAIEDGDTSTPVSLDSVSASFMLAKFRLGSSFSTSSAGALTTKTESYSISRPITSSISASGSVFRFHTGNTTAQTWVTSVQEKISPRINIYQGLSRAGNTNNLVWGARFMSNRLTVGIEQNMMYSPLAGGFSGKQYMQAWSINLSIPLIRGIRLHADSYVDPSGKMRYTTWADGIGFSRDGEQNPASSAAVVTLGKFIVRGRVVDPDGKPVWGIAIQVDGKMTYSDSTGQFFLRFSRGETYPVTVLLDQSLNRMAYQVVQARVTATAELESVAPEVIIVVRPLVTARVRR